MSCLKPLCLFYSLDPETNKKQIVAIRNPSNYKKFDEEKTTLFKNLNFVYIPCGKCIGCKLDYGKQWSNRIMLESKDYEHNWFITLTYDNELKADGSYKHLPTTLLLNTDDEGKYIDHARIPTLRKKDLQDFLKRLRKNSGQKFRYYACGEYGSVNGRPHYHICLLNFRINDLKFDYMSGDGYKFYTSEFISNTWKNGLISINEMTRETASYTARYCMKKAENDMDYEVYSMENEFTTMSRRPGIGYKYFKEFKDYFIKYDSMIINNNGSSYVCSLPRYFDKLLDVSDPEVLLDLKISREKKYRDMETIPKCTSLDDEDYRLTQQCVLKGKIKSLKRSL